MRTIRDVLVRLSQSPSLLISGSRSLARLRQKTLKIYRSRFALGKKKGKCFSLVILPLDPNRV